MWFQGTLAVKAVNGRNGPFNVAKLHLEIGEFAIKHPLIQQLDEGRYPVTADVENIFIATRPANGASISELAVWARDLQIQSDEAQENSDDNDPLMAPGLVEEPEDEIPDPPAPVASKDEPQSADGSDLHPTSDEDAEPDPDSEVAKLFGDLAQAVLARQPVKLDPASGLMRKQVAYLKANGFRFKSTDKIWLPIIE